LTTRQIDSNVERQLRRTGDSPLKGPHEPRHVPADDARQRAFTGHLNVYYDAVSDALKGADAVLIFGPGEAKDELRKRLEEHGTGANIVAVEAKDQMTDPQIAAHVRERFTR
jgi:hypothetical protein